MSASEHVVISVPSAGSPRIEFLRSLLAMYSYTIRNLPSVIVEMNDACSSSVADNRMKLIQIARETRPTHLLWLDDDMVFPSDTLARLLRHKKAIIGANYTSRKFPVIPHAVRGGQRVGSAGKSGLERVDQMGLGVVLTEMRVFDAIDEFMPDGPYFNFGWDRKRKEIVSEDIWFFALARKAGFDAWVDHDLSQKVGHVGYVEFSHDLIEGA
jgi:hypothetical protein